MEDVWRGGLVCLFLYGNYLLFSGHITTVFWAVCYSVVCREVKKNHLQIFQPVFMILSFFPVLSVTLLPSVMVLLCGKEIGQYAVSMIQAVHNNPSIQPTVKRLFLSSMLYLCDYLDIHRNEKLSDSYVLYKIYLKLDEIKEQVLSGSKYALGWIGHFAFFIGFVVYFTGLQDSPVYYILKPVPRHSEITKLFERIVYTLATGSIFTFLWSFLVSMYFGSSLVVVNGTVSSFLSIFPILPLFIYTVPTGIELFLMKRPFSAGLFVVLGVIQQVVFGRIFKFARKEGYLKSASTALGLSVFGLAGAILGPFLLYSLLILWPAERPDTHTAVAPLIKRQAHPKRMTRTMEILRKAK